MAFPWMAELLASAGEREDGRDAPRPLAVPDDGPDPQTPPHADDTALLARLRADDEDALRTIMQTHADSVIAVARYVVGSRDLALDVAQEVFLDLWERRHTLALRGALGHYVRRAARNRALNRRAHERVHTRLHERLAERGRDANAPVHAENAGAAAVTNNELAEAVTRAMQRLTPRVREVFQLYYEHALEPGEIAALLGVAPRTVYNQLRTAMHAVGAALGAWRE